VYIFYIRTLAPNHILPELTFKGIGPERNASNNSAKVSLSFTACFHVKAASSRVQIMPWTLPLSTPNTRVDHKAWSFDAIVVLKIIN